MEDTHVVEEALEQLVRNLNLSSGSQIFSVELMQGITVEEQ